MVAALETPELNRIARRTLSDLAIESLLLIDCKTGSRLPCPKKTGTRF